MKWIYDVKVWEKITLYLLYILFIIGLALSIIGITACNSSGSGRIIKSDTVWIPGKGSTVYITVIDTVYLKPEIIEIIKFDTVKVETIIKDTITLIKIDTIITKKETVWKYLDYDSTRVLNNEVVFFFDTLTQIDRVEFFYRSDKETGVNIYNYADLIGTKVIQPKKVETLELKFIGTMFYFLYRPSVILDSLDVKLLREVTEWGILI